MRLYGRRRVHLVAEAGNVRLRSRTLRFALAGAARLALTLTGPWATAWVQRDGVWLAVCRLALHTISSRLREQSWLDDVSAQATGCTDAWAGPFGQVGLRDLRWVTHPDGTTYRLPGDPALWLTATSAGAGFFDTCHTSIWRLDPQTYTLTHSADLHAVRDGAAEPGRVFGVCAVHLVREAGRWVLATSAWGHFKEPSPRERVWIELGHSTADLLSGQHRVPTRPLDLPVPEPTVGLWDPSLLREQTPSGDNWLLGFVRATRYFDFHPGLARGRTLHDLDVVALDEQRNATEGVHLVQTTRGPLMLVSDGPDSRATRPRRWPVLDLALREVGQLDSPYPTNIPWPMLISTDQSLIVTFNGKRAGGPLLGYGTHGDVIVLRARNGNGAAY